MDILNFENASNLLTYGTGIPYSPKKLITVLGEAIEREYQLSIKFGVQRDDDTLPERFINEALSEGLTKGSTVDIKYMVDEYYRLHER